MSNIALLREIRARFLEVAGLPPKAIADSFSVGLNGAYRFPHMGFVPVCGSQVFQYTASAFPMISRGHGITGIARVRAGEGTAEKIPAGVPIAHFP